MIIDNETGTLKVHEWITKYAQEGQLSIVTGYFTVGALEYLSKTTKGKIEEYKFILGDIVSFDDNKSAELDLLNENISIEASLKLRKVAQEAVFFLELDKVSIKTLEPNFCHAKAYLHNSNIDGMYNFFIIGSSNLTEAGIGKKVTSNVELNLAETGDSNQYKELIKWFESLWNRPQAHIEKTVKREDGKIIKIPFKQYIIDEIKKIFINYTPKQLYYKVLFELFGAEILLEIDNPEFNRQIGRLENTAIWNAPLYEFQQKGALSLIRMLQKYNGAILADAVGLGKTWTALAVMKFFEMQGREVILFCPKKLQHNWLIYKKNFNSRFKEDKFDYYIRFHTDLTENLMEKYFYEREDVLFVNDKPKLFVIDESHNLRNDKSQRYKFLVEQILSKNKDAKVLMLSATPINNSLLDIRNQFKLIVSGDVRGFEESLDIKNLDYTFRSAQRAFNNWIQEASPKIGDFIKKLPSNFFVLTDALTVARTRKMIEGQQNGLVFPIKLKPDNVFVTPKQIGNFESFEELFDHFPPMLSGYQPTFYTISSEERKKRLDHKKKTNGKSTKLEISPLEDELQRDRFLVKMMYILLVKRLESSWFSFKSTAEKILKHHQNALDKILQYQKTKKDIELDEGEIGQIDDGEMQEELDSFSLGKKRPIKLSQIDEAGNLEAYKNDLKSDIQSLQLLQSNMLLFEKKIENEINKKKNHKSEDEKLEALISRINHKRKTGNNNANQKVLIFTVYKDTAFYLFEQLKARGFENIAAVSGDASVVWNQDGETKNFEPILERFAPFTKLFREKEWKFKPTSNDVSLDKQFDEWKIWVEENDTNAFQKLQNPIDILIATDTLSEGQNLQDCDFVVNYDIHWNPVRVIQRMGRIDRLGSPNSTIYGLNFWPSNNINSYLNLQGRIEKRMAAMKLAGSEVDLEFSDTFKDMAEDENLEKLQNERMLKQMQTSWDDIEVSEQGLGFDSFSLETYRQELASELSKDKLFYKTMPKGVFTGFVANKQICSKKGIIALLGYPSRPPKSVNYKYRGRELIYIDEQGNEVFLNQKEVLDALSNHKDCVRDNDGLRLIDQGDQKSIQKLSDMINIWLKNQTVEEVQQDDGTVKQMMGKASLDLINKLKSGSKDGIEQLKSEGAVSKKYVKENFDLITWFIVN